MLRTDMRVTCKHCGGPHPAFECRKKSTAAKITSPDGTGLDNSTVGVGGSLRGSTPKLPVSETTAGKALPVDTNNPSSRKGSGVESLRMPTEGRKGRDSTSGGARAKLRDPSAVLTQTAAQPPVGTNSVVAHPRPGEKVSAGQHSTGSQAGYDGAPAGQSKFDKKAWMREYMKIYMARYREDVKSGKRTPKKKVKAS